MYYNTINTTTYASRRRMLEVRRHNRRVRRIAMSIYTLAIVAFTIAVSFAAIYIAGYSISRPVDEYTSPAIVRDLNNTLVSDLNSMYLDNRSLIPMALSMDLVHYSAPVATVETPGEPEVVETPAEPEVVEAPAPYINPNARPSGVPEDKYFGWSEADFIWLRRALVGECQNCSREEQMETGSVVLNRLYNKKYFSYANTIEEVLMAKGQYTSMYDGNAYREPTNLNTEVAMELLKNGSISPNNVIYQSLGKQGDGVYKYFPDTGTYICYKD